MTEQRLLAAIALFRELYNNNKNIYDILAEFIRAGVLINSKWAFNSIECVQILESTFGFDIPEAVVKSCLKNRLVNSKELVLQNGIYSVSDKFDKNKNINAEFIQSQGVYAEICEQLISYVNSKCAIQLDESEEKKLISDFNRYLLRENISQENASYCSYFILANQSDTQFKSKLNQIEEGLVLYAGIKHSADNSNREGWHGELTIFLDTEHLFSATGLNGLLYKRIFDDFNNLVKEINGNRKKAGTVNLRYFEEVKNEVDNFFFAAESLVDKHQLPSALKTAMVSITNGCASRGDVIEKKAKFFDDLRRLQIEEESPCDYYANPKYNVESAVTIAQLCEKSKGRDKDVVSAILKLFTKINCLRKGESNLGLERVGAIFMTEHKLTTTVSLSPEVYQGNGAVPFATDIEFMIEKFWFKLNKGFGGEQVIPALFDVVTRAQLVLSSQINHQVSEQFKKLKEKYDAGEITKEQAALMNQELRGKSFRPEEITFERIDESIEFLKGSYIENAMREKSLLERDAEKGRQALRELEKFRLQKKEHLIEPLKKVARRQFYLASSLVYFFVPVGIFSYFLSLIAESDTKLSVVFGLLSLVPFLPIFKYKVINSYIWKFSRKQYKSQRRKIGA